MTDVLIDALTDTLKLLPFLLALYILIEVIEHRTAMGKPHAALAGRAAPLVGAATGLVPMCGFSVMAAKLYERRYLTLGALIAVFVATNDEALLVLALSPLPWTEKLLSVALLCVLKFALGAGAGYLVDMVAKRRFGTCYNRFPPRERERGHGGEHGGEHGEEGEPHACEHRHENRWTIYLLSPLLHALEVAAVIFLFNFAFGALLWGLGAARVIGFLQDTGYWYQPLVASLLGSVPNCASSVLLAEVYAAGGIAFGSLLGGLVTNAGLGVLFLFRNGRAVGRNAAVFGLMLVLGIAVGYAGNAILLLF